MASGNARNYLSAVLCVCALTPAAQASVLPLRTFTTADGLPSNRVSRIVRDPRGFLWFCTRDGLSRFDGSRFVNFGIEQGLPLGADDLVITQSGDYWVATGDGVARFDTSGGRQLFTVYRPAEKDAHWITALADDGMGGLWCATAKGLYRLRRSVNARQENAWTFALVDIGLHGTTWDDNFVTTLLRDRSGTIWAGGYNGLYQLLPDGTWKQRSVNAGLPHPHVTSLLQSRDGKLWVGTWHGLCLLSPNGSTKQEVESTYDAESGLNGNVIKALLESSDGTLWVGTNTALNKCTRSGGLKIEKITKADGLMESEINDVAEDSAGNLWIASSGVTEMIRGGFVRYGTEDGLDSTRITSLFEDRLGRFCATSRDAAGRMHVNCFDGKCFHAVLPNVPRRVKDWGWGGNQLCFQDQTGNWWVPTGRDLFRFPASAGTLGLRGHPEAIYRRGNALHGEGMFRVFEDSNGDVWLSGSNRLTVWRRAQSRLQSLSSDDGLPADFLAWAFAEDRAKNLWVGFDGRLGRIRKGRFEMIDIPKGAGTIRSFYCDQGGRLWAGCSRGVLRIDEPGAQAPKGVLYSTAEGLASNDVEGITQDSAGRIYAGTGRGVDSFYPSLSLRVNHYTKADGLVEGSPMMAFRDRNGALWFGNDLGLMRLTPAPDERASAPVVIISEFKIRGIPHALSALGETELKGLELAADQNQLEIGFVGLEFRAGKKLSYQYRLEGGGEGWAAPTNEGAVTYASLSPGDYRFSVRAISSDGLMSERPATLALTIMPAIWQRQWVRGILLLMMGGILYALYRYRVEQLLAVERVRSRIAADLHDDIGSTLSQISILSEVASREIKEQRVDSLQEIANLSRESVSSMSDIVWAINPEQDRLDQLVHRMRRFASDLSAGNGVQIRFSAPVEERNLQIGSDARRQIFLIFKESLRNAMRHSAGKHVNVSMGVKDGWLTLSIQDDGCGFDCNNAEMGHGLISIKQRACGLHGKVEILSTRAQGTTILVEIPLNHGSWRPGRSPA